MFPFSLYSEVYMTFDQVLFSGACRALEDNHISYTCKTETMGRTNRAGTMLGSFGENLNYKTVFYIYTKRKDASLASKTINDYIRTSGM